MRINFASSQQTAAFNKSPPENITDRFYATQQQAPATGSLKSVNDAAQNELSQEVEQQTEPQLSKEILVEYLEAVAVADSAKSSNAKIGYVVTAAALTAVAFLAIKCIGLVQENLVLHSHLHNCQNPPADPTHTEIANFNSFNIVNDGPYLGAAANMISNFFGNAPSSIPLEEGCKHVPFSVGDQKIGIQKICLSTIFNENSEGNESSTLTLTTEPHALKPYNGTSALYNRVHIFCEEQKTTGPSVFEFSSSCTGSIGGEKSMNDLLTQTSPVCTANYQNSEKINAQVTPKGIFVSHIATESGESQKTTSATHFRGTEELKAPEFEILSELLGLN